MTAAYVVDFPKPSIPASRDPIGVLHFAINYLGSSLRGYPHASLPLGMALLAVYALTATVLARRWARQDELDPVLVWLVGVGAFVVSGALVTGIGRLSLGLESSISSRYAIQSLLFVGCVLLMVWRLLRSLQGSARVVVAAAGLTISLASTFAASPLEEWRARVAAYDTAGAAFAEGVLADDFVKGVYPFPDLIRPVLVFMQDHRLGPFSSRYADLYRPPVNALGYRAFGTLPLCENNQDSVSNVGSHWAEIRGWAFEREDPEDRGWIVALDHDLRVIGFTRQTVERPDVADVYHLPRSNVSYILGLNLPERLPGASSLLQTSRSS